jgi:uncharacterized protein
MNSHLAYTLLSAALLLPGIAAAFFPIFPALLYMTIVTGIYGIATNWQTLTGGEYAILAVLMVISVIIDQVSGILGAKYGGASRRAMGWGFIGGLIGTLTAGPIGTVIGVFTAILAAEISQFRSNQAALRAAAGGVLGALVGIALTVILAVVFVIMFLVYAL